MRRAQLDRITQDYRLTESAVNLALDLTGARPDAAAWRALTLRLLHGAGLAALAAGAIFFVAANWQAYGVLGRFAILETAFLACVGIALWAVPRSLGRAALILATLLTGALLALLGQSYQTGADLYELFVTWALFSLPFALAARSAAQWAVWWAVVNVALALYCGGLDPGHIVWSWLLGGRIERSVMIFAGCVVNLVGAAAFGYLGRTRFSEASPRWLVRMLATFAFLFGTAACIAAVMQGGGVGSSRVPLPREDVAVVAVFAMLCAALGAATLRRWRDVFVMALIAASWIAISTAYLIREVGRDAGAFFILAAWLIAASTASAFLLMRWVRAWGIGEGSGAAQ